MRHLLLASSSRYRQQLLARLRLPFDSCAPEIDETALPGESAEHRLILGFGWRGEFL